MTTMADSLVNSAMRPLRLRRRPDLESRRHMYHGRSYLVVKEPVGLNYFRFHEEEFAILNMLDGETSLQDIRDRFQAEFAPQRITIQDLQQFIGMLHRSGLVISNSTGQGRQLRRRGYDKKKKELLGKLANVFAIRFRGIDPENILNRLLPWFGWLFGLPGIILVLTLGLSALTLVLVNFSTFQAKLPTFENFFQKDNWIWLGLTMAVVKVLHEFGHGLSCKRFGGECHEMGFMMLVFTPCLYCNVSDSWMLPNKWQRVFIGASGMYVELLLASIATFVWWNTEPGLLNFLALSVVFICSVSTVVFNGNPLLRFDGYYILMDILEIPNLRQKSSEVLKRWFQQTCLGLELQDNPFLPTRRKFWFAMYTVAAVIYRWVVVFSIVFFLNQVLEPIGLQILGRLFAIMGFFGLIAQPIIGTFKFFRTPGRASRMKRGRVITTALVTAALLGIFFYLPFPYHVDCAVEIQPKDAFAVRTMVPGKMVSLNVSPGQSVEEGSQILKLENIDLEQQLLKYQNEATTALQRLNQATRDSKLNRDRAWALKPAEMIYESAYEMVKQSENRIAQLDVVAPIQGQIIEPDNKDTPSGAQDQLPGWTGSPFDTENEGAFFSEGELICYIGNPAEMEGVIIIDQADIDLIDPEKHRVEMMLDSARLHSLEGVITEISKADMKETSANLASQTGGALNTMMDPTGRIRPISTSYQAKVAIDPTDIPMRAGYRGQAKIHLEWKSLGWRVWRFISKTFKFDF